MPSNYPSRAGHFVCGECGAALSLQLVVEAEVWERVRGDDYALCPSCLDERCDAAGIKAEALAVFYGKALVSHVPNHYREIMLRWQLP